MRGAAWARHGELGCLGSHVSSMCSAPGWGGVCPPRPALRPAAELALWSEARQGPHTHCSAEVADVQQERAARQGLALGARWPLFGTVAHALASLPPFTHIFLLLGASPWHTRRRPVLLDGNHQAQWSLQIPKSAPQCDREDTVDSEDRAGAPATWRAVHLNKRWRCVSCPRGLGPL